MTRLPFRIEYQRPDGSWVMETGNQDASLRYLEGYLAAYAERTPRLAARIVRDRDGRVMQEVSASSRPKMGMVAGWPSPEQCVDAATRALRAMGPVGADERGGEVYGRIEAALRILEGE